MNTRQPAALQEGDEVLAAAAVAVDHVQDIGFDQVVEAGAGDPEELLDSSAREERGFADDAGKNVFRGQGAGALAWVEQFAEPEPQEAVAPGADIEHPDEDAAVRGIGDGLGWES